MRHIYLFILFNLFLVYARGQSISVPYAYIPPQCAGSVLKLAFTPTGSFESGNVFRVQVSSADGQPFVDLPGSFVSSPASITLPANLIIGDQYRLRVVSTKPALISEESNVFTVAQPPTANLIGTSLGTTQVNPFTPGQLLMELTGGAPYTVMFTDSTRFTQIGETATADEFRIYPPRTTTYQLATVQNACGLGTVRNATALVQVNNNDQASLLVVNPTSSVVCLGKPYPVYFSTDVPLPPNIEFGAEISLVNSPTLVTPLSVTGTSSPLLLQLPASVVPDGGYQIRIFVRGTGSSAYVQGSSGPLLVFGKAQLDLIDAAAPVPFGDPALVTLNYTGPSAIAYLDDGTRFTLPHSFSAPYSAVVPLKGNTTFRLKSYDGECGADVEITNASVLVQTQPGIRTDSLSTKEVCAGESFTLYYTAHPQYKLPDKLTVKALPGGQVFTVSKPKDGQLLVTPPTTATPISSTAFQIRDATRDSLIKEMRYPFFVKVRPSLVGLVRSFTLNTPGDIRLTGSFGGDWRTDVKLASGETLIYQSMFPYPTDPVTLPSIYLPVSRTLVIASAQNECGVSTFTNNNTVEVTVSGTVSQTPSIQLRSTKAGRPACQGEVVWFNLTTQGEFGPDNYFKVSVTTFGYPYGPDVTPPPFTKPGNFSLVVPSPGLSGYSIRVLVSSTQPVTQSEIGISVFEHSVFGAQTYVYAQPFGNSSYYEQVSSLTTTAGQPVYVAYNIRGPGGISSSVDYTLLDGTKGSSNLGSLRAEYRPIQTTTYGLIKRADVCRTLAYSSLLGQATVHVSPAAVITGIISQTNVCTGTPLAVPFEALGAVPQTYTAVVQLYEYGSVWQDIPTSGQSSPLSATVPASFSNKRYRYRVVLRSAGTELVGQSSIEDLRVGTVPDAELSVPLWIDYRNFVQIQVRSPFSSTATFTDGQVVSLPAYGSSMIIPKLPGQISVSSIYNQCGYGQGRGTLLIKAENLSIASLNVSKPRLCATDKQTVNYAVIGTIPTGARLSLQLVSKSGSFSITLTETDRPSGSFTFTPGRIPFVNSGDSYSIRMRLISNGEQPIPSFTYVGNVVFTVDEPLSVSLTSGSVSIYAGDSTPLTVIASPTSSGSLVLSNDQSLVMGYGYAFAYVRPTQTTTYSIVSAQNGCGLGQVSGTATVTVLPIVNDLIIRHYLEDYREAYCTGQSYRLSYYASGTFAANNTMTVELSDSTGNSFFTIPSVSGPNWLNVTIPAGYKPGDKYRFRVVSSNPAHTGATTQTPITIRETSTGVLSGKAVIQKGDSTQIRVFLTGAPPWILTVGSDSPTGSMSYVAHQSPYPIMVRPETTTSYQLLSVDDALCPNGRVAGTALILLGQASANDLTLNAYPNPTTGWVRVEGQLKKPGTVQIRVVNRAGQLVRQLDQPDQSVNYRYDLDLSEMPTGLYTLVVETDERKESFKLIKQ